MISAATDTNSRWNMNVGEQLAAPASTDSPVTGRQGAGPYKPDPGPEQDQRRAIRESPLQGEAVSPVVISNQLTNW